MCVDDTVLEKFVSENDSSFSLGNVEMKTKEIILERCRRVLESDSSSDLYICLSCIRILTRDEISRKELTSDFFLSQLLKYAFPYGAGSQCCRINIEALKSLSNIIFKETYVISRLKELGVVKNIVEGLKVLEQCSEKEQLLLCLKLAFLVTALDHSSRQELIDFEALQLLLKVLQMKRSDISDSLVVAEALKTVYNILYSVRDDSDMTKLGDDIQNLVIILKHLLKDSEKDNFDNHMLISQIVNVLNIIPKASYKYLLCDKVAAEHCNDKSSEHSLPVSETNEMDCIEILVNFLHCQLKLDANKVSEATDDLRTDERICPILNCLTRACKSNHQIRKFCRLKVLPYLGKDVTRLPEDGDSIRNHLCKLLTHPVQIVGESAALFIFVLCKENIGRAVKYTGFGNFAGFLARHALLGKPSKANRNSNSNALSSDVEYSETSTESETEEYKSLKDDVNPVTGRWEIPKANPIDNMSDEQKEYLAMDLVQKIDKLERSGLIQPGTIGEDGRVRPVQHVLELLQQTKEDNQKSDDSTEEEVDK